MTNREKMQLVDALRSTHALAGSLEEVGLPRISFFYPRARPELGDKYAAVRGHGSQLREQLPLRRSVV